MLACSLDCSHPGYGKPIDLYVGHVTLAYSFLTIGSQRNPTIGVHKNIVIAVGSSQYLVQIPAGYVKVIAVPD